MILTTLIAVTALTSPVADYFPMEPGTRWTYEDGEGRQLEEQVGAAITIGTDQTAFPKSQIAAGRTLGRTLYRIDGDTVYVVGSLEKPKDPSVSKEPFINVLPSAQPVLRVSAAGKAEWNWSDQVFGQNGPVSVHVSSTSNKGPRRKVLDRDVETIVVHSTARYGNGRNAFDIKQDYVYGKGIGMVETVEVTKVQGKTVKKMLKLVKFEPPEG